MEVQGLPGAQGLGAMPPTPTVNPVTTASRSDPGVRPGLGTLPGRVAHVTADVTGLRAGPNRAPRPNIAEPGRATGVPGRVWPAPSPGRGGKARTPRRSRPSPPPAPRPQDARPRPYLARSPAAGAARGPGAPGSGART